MADWPGHFPLYDAGARRFVFRLVLSVDGRRSLAAMFAPEKWYLGVCRRLPPAVGVDCLARRARVISRINMGVLFLDLGFARLRVDGGLPVNGVPQIMGYIFFVALGTGPGLFAEQTYVAFALLAVLGFTCVGPGPHCSLKDLN